MELFFNIPVIVKIFTVFALILLLLRYKYSLGTGLVVGSFVLGLWCRLNLFDILLSMGRAMLQSKTIMMNLVVTLILILSHLMEILGQMKRLLSSFQGLLKNPKLNLVAFPTIIGLLPMPGGAIFSAPMVDVLGTEHQLTPETKTLINYVFRHVWEPGWPLYPGVLLAASLASVNIWRYAATAAPIVLVAVVAGYLFLFRTIAWHPVKQNGTVTTSQVLSFFQEMIPILLVVIGAITGGAIMAWLQLRFTSLKVLPTELPLVIFLVISILWVLRSHQASFDTFRKVLLSRSLLKMVYMVTTIFAFKEILVDSHAVEEVSQSLVRLNIPLVPVVILLPGLIGFITGIGVAFVGTTFPVIISLLQTLRIEQIIPYLVLAYVSGYIGMMLSPLHICLIVTREYFQAEFRPIYRQLWKPLLLVFVCSLGYFALLLAL